MAGKQSLAAASQPSTGSELHLHSNTPRAAVLHQEVCQAA